MHPLVRIVGLIAFGVALQPMRWQTLLIVGLLLMPVILWQASGVFIALIRRARWLLLSMTLIYAYATPGEYLAGLPDVIAPTYEGLQAGSLQAARLIAMLAALSILLTTSGREDFIIGVYQLFLPFRKLGISPEKFAVRLWLTLHYVESMPPETMSNLRQQGWSLDSLQNHNDGPEEVHLEYHPLKMSDMLMLLAIPLAFWAIT